LAYRLTKPEPVHRELYQKLAAGCEVMRERRSLAPVIKPMETVRDVGA